MTDYRVVRVPLPARLLQAIDEIVDTGMGAYGSRSEFVRDAVEAMVLEVRYGGAENGQARAADEPTPRKKSVPSDASPFSGGGSGLHTATVLGPCPACAVITDGVAQVANQPLFGLHNRDYPSLWAARQLADLTSSGTIAVEDFYTRVADAAWRHGEMLSELERTTNQKLTALFPTNRTKPESSEAAFLNFAVGGYRRGQAGIEASGPLFVWALVQLELEDGRLLVGLTPQGRELLEGLADLSLETPHERDLALAFFRHLAEYASSDFEGQLETLRIVASGATRQRLVEEISSVHDNWTKTVSATNAAGYIARGREWGLIAPNQAEGRYVLTSFGSDFLETNQGGSVVHG